MCVGLHVKRLFIFCSILIETEYVDQLQ